MFATTNLYQTRKTYRTGIEDKKIMTRLGIKPAAAMWVIEWMTVRFCLNKVSYLFYVVVLVTVTSFCLNKVSYLFYVVVLVTVTSSCLNKVSYLFFEVGLYCRLWLWQVSVWMRLVIYSLWLIVDCESYCKNMKAGFRKVIVRYFRRRYFYQSTLMWDWKSLKDLTFDQFRDVDYDFKKRSNTGLGVNLTFGV